MPLQRGSPDMAARFLLKRREINSEYINSPLIPSRAPTFSTLKDPNRDRHSLRIDRSALTE